MVIGELSRKAEFIANRQQCLRKQWQQYRNTLTQGITLSKYKLHHTISCSADDDLCFRLFNYFIIRIRLADGFNNHTIEYTLEHGDGSHRALIGESTIDDKGYINGVVDTGDREQVLEHYLRMMCSVYDGLYQATGENASLSRQSTVA